MRQNKYCNCRESTNKIILKSEINCSFCDKCGSILLKDEEGNIFYTVKSKQHRLPYDLNPITIIKNMKKKTEEEYPFIYQEFNFNKNDEYIKEKVLKSLNFYRKHRKMLLMKLQKLVRTFDYCDIVFYQCLFYLDTYLSHNLTEDISEKKLLYYLIGFFLFSVKFKETDIYEPDFDAFYDLSKGIYLSTEKIAYYEVLCLKQIKYNIFSYSAYDWVNQLISNGIVFNCEINKNNEIILIRGHRHSLLNVINKQIIRLLLDITSKNIFYKYAPMYIAFSLIQIARKKYLNKTMIKPELFINLVKIYGVNPDDYKQCYEEINEEIKDYFISESDNNKNYEEKENLNEVERKTNIRYSCVDKYPDNYVKNKMKSSNVIISLNSRNQDINENLINELSNTNEESDMNINLKEEKSKMKNKKMSVTNIKTINRYSIDCNSSQLKSNDQLPNINTIDIKERNSLLTINAENLKTVNSKYMSLNKKKIKPDIKELKHTRPNQTRFNSIESKNLSTNPNSILSSTKKEKEKERDNFKKKSRFFSNKNINFNFNQEKIDLTNQKSKFTSKKLPKITGFDEFNIDRTKTKIEEPNRISNTNKNKKLYKLKKDVKVSLQKEELNN